ncbi:MAG: YhdP family protein [Rhodocyclaceae bacterium]|nr:YhdP family protein [Rhodocyclaceae bacterium]MDZ4213756.1 YhdP family protein [Rhodocyclaceae bacterium]
MLLLAYFAAGALILFGRYYLMPEISGQREWIAAKLTEAVGLPIQVAGLTAAWPGLHPRLVIDGLQIHDREGRPALMLERVEAEVGWSSLWYLSLRLHRLKIQAPALELRRDMQGKIYVAGLPMEGEEQGGLLPWLLQQSKVVIRDARIVWHDELRAAPPLELNPLHFELRNFGRHHSFGLSAQPLNTGARRLDLRGNLVGSDPGKLADWRGELYADLEEADISIWKAWLDLPFEMHQGRGGVRFWLEFENLQPLAVTADLSLSGMSARLRPDLPVLALETLHGRLAARKTADGYAGEMRRFSLTTHDGIAMPSSEAQITLNTVGRRLGGEFSIAHLDLGMLATLAQYLPLPNHLLDRLKTFAPAGQVDEVKLTWRGAIDAPTDWSAKGRFAGLALAAYKELPGFSGISGRFSGEAKAGEIILDSQDVRIELPAVFPEPTLALAKLQIEAGWRAREGGTEFQLARANFLNDDAVGEAAGTYHYTGDGLGVIDLSAKLKQASGHAVWRYMPLVVNTDARDWLRAGIVGGMSDEVSLRLKGPLDAFPFADGKQGIFQVKGTIRGASLNFAPGWPQITGIDGDLLFEGVRMLIRGQRAEMMGVALSEVRAEIAHLDALEELLVVTGKAQGETQRFLDFIEASPVGEMIDHFTAPMSAKGKGSLDLKLELPLRKLAETRVQGKYQFTDNQVRVLPVLPVLTTAQGEFAFTEKRLEGKGLRARLLGSPVTASVTSGTGGTVRIDAKGTLTARGAWQEYGWPVLEHLSGETGWTANIRVKKPGAEVRIESSLEGISSSLPAPFNKPTRMALPLKLNARIDKGMDEWTGTVGDIAALRLLMGDAPARGRLALGDAAKLGIPALPGQGLAVTIAQPSFDLDTWRTLLARNNNGSNTDSAVAFSLPAIELKSGTLRAFQREFHDVRLNISTTETSRWRMNLESREARGQLTWDASGSGRLSGHLPLLALPAPIASAAVGADAPYEDMSPPDLDLLIDDFRLKDMAFGEVRINAENRAGAWKAKLDVKNEAARFSGEGRWRRGQGQPETALAFKLDVEDSEKLLGRLGFVDAVRRGSGKLEGDVAWPGGPVDFELAKLSGRVKADIGKGQFKKLEPGVGRLLGVLSLQSLPRRITLDFRDIFSEGFAFDSIVGSAVLDKGQLQTDELRIRGPAAKILLSGQVDLVHETQNLKVRVQPSLGETVATGAMLVNPVVGAVAWLAQKALNDPLDQMFAYEYAVSGNWQDPKVDKLHQAFKPSPGSPP